MISNSRPTGIYVLRCRFLYKIGVAKEAAIRTRAFQTGNPFKLELVLWIPSDNPRRDEKRWHRFFRDVRVRGEWYKLTPYDVDTMRSGPPPANETRILKPRSGNYRKHFEKPTTRPENYRNELALLDWCIQWVNDHPSIPIPSKPV